MRDLTAFNKISELMKAHGHRWNSDQCKRKLSALKTAYQTAKLANGTSGAARQTCSCYDELDQIFFDKAWVQPTNYSGCSKNSPMNTVQKGLYSINFRTLFSR